MSQQIPLVDYLVLGDEPHLVANECVACGARFFDRRNACAACSGTEFRITGPAWGGAVPIAHVDVQIDDGPWQRAQLEAARSPYAWRLWSLTVDSLAPGPHTVRSRATDANGRVQPTPAERRQQIASGREDFSIWTRQILV